MWDDFTFLDFVGLVGALTICAAYLAVSVRRVDPEGFRFHLIDASGSIPLLVARYFRPNPGAILVEGLWIGIAGFGPGRALLKRR